VDHLITVSFAGATTGGWQGRHIAAANFKANCLRLMDEVAQQRKPIVNFRRR
jgi:hypothetical protein